MRSDKISHWPSNGIDIDANGAIYHFHLSLVTPVTYTKHLIWCQQVFTVWLKGSFLTLQLSIQLANKLLPRGYKIYLCHLSPQVHKLGIRFELIKGSSPKKSFETLQLHIQLAHELLLKKHLPLSPITSVTYNRYMMSYTCSDIDECDEFDE